MTSASFHVLLRFSIQVILTLFPASAKTPRCSCKYTTYVTVIEENKSTFHTIPNSIVIIANSLAMNIFEGSTSPYLKTLVRENFHCDLESNVTEAHYSYAYHLHI